MRLIAADALLDKFLRSYTEQEKKGKFSFVAAEIKQGFADMLETLPTVETVTYSQITKVIAGHSNYHGDDILSALVCIAEGKDVKPVKPIDAVPVVRCGECLHGEVDDPDFPRQHYCKQGCGWNDADFFCAHGERREVDGDGHMG